MKVLFTKKSKNSIFSLIDYLSDIIQMPETAARYADRMHEFGLALGVTPYGWPICKSISLSQKGYRCAVFEKQWIFVYSILNNRIIIQDVKNGSLIVD